MYLLTKKIHLKFKSYAECRHVAYDGLIMTFYQLWSKWYNDYSLFNIANFWSFGVKIKRRMMHSRRLTKILKIRLYFLLIFQFQVCSVSWPNGSDSYEIELWFPAFVYYLTKRFLHSIPVWLYLFKAMSHL